MTREEAIKAIRWHWRNLISNSYDEKAFEMAISALEQPEFVRCKDCTRFDKKRGCNLVEGLNIAKADSFCSYAERKEQNDCDT